MIKKSKLLMFLIFVLASLIRVFGIDWDQGYHLHPDERMLIMVADHIRFFDNLNPNFFNYGTFPLYLLKGLAQLSDFFLFTHIANYNGLLYLGRFLSIIADIGVVFLIYKISQLLFVSNSRKQSNTLPLLAAVLYAIAFFPIQNAHFFIVDVFLNLEVTFLLYLLLQYGQKPQQKTVIFIGIIAGIILATKVTGIIFVGTAFIITMTLSFPPASQKLQRGERKRESSSGSLPAGRQGPIKSGMAYVGATLLSFFICMPYAFLEFQRFFSDIISQSKMNSDPYIFPYTLQYVDTTPYLYYLKNIFFWGLEPVISLAALLGIAAALIKVSRKKLSPLFLILFLFYALYFLIIGKSAVKFMRYMLPLYPLFVILATDGIHQVEHYVANKLFKRKFSPQLNTALLILPLVAATIWTIPFLNLYTQKHTRIAATEWINTHIPVGKTIAIEHWDDRLPLIGSERYNILELPLYNRPDDTEKFVEINRNLEVADYIIIASNRLHVPLQKLADCTKYKVCYPKTAEYYMKLFSGQNVIPAKAGIQFQKVAEFNAYPTIPLLNYQINDQGADESFTVYDHPQIFIFAKKNGAR